MTDAASASEATGIPEELIQRAADARAAADGVSADELLAAWAGGSDAPVGTPPPAPVESSDDVPAEEPATVVEAPAPAAAQASVAAVGTISAPPPAATVRGSAALDYDAVITVPTAGLAERTTAPTPRWLTLLFMVLPLVGLTYLITFANGPNCGVGGQLSVDRLSGAVESCDGTEYVAAGAALGGVDVRAIILEGAALYNATPGNCTTCHGASGEGGTGPTLNGAAVIETFGACADHLDWVSNGTAGYQSLGIATYGDTAKTVGSGGVMPPFGVALTAEQLAAVVFYERVQFGGQDPTEAAVDCGFITPEEDPPAAEPTAAIE